MGLLIFYIVLAIATSFLCSVLEAVLLSITPGHMAAMEKSGHPRATSLRGYKDDIDKPLAAILSLNTIAHTVGAAGAGAQATEVFGDQWIGLFSAILTFAILFFSEIIPKTIGAVFWKQLTGFVVVTLNILMPPLKPLVWASGLASGVISGGHKPGAVSREELTALADLGHQQGVLDEGESRILQALLRFRSLRADDIMTPRTVVFALPETTKCRELFENAAAMRFSRIPVFGESVDDIMGFVLKDDVLKKVAEDQPNISLSELKRPLQLVPQETTVSSLLELLLRTRAHMVLVVDSYGGTAGLLTLEDVVETLLEVDIVDEADNVENLRKAARADWVRRAKARGLVEPDEAPGDDSAQDQPTEEPS